MQVFRSFLFFCCVTGVISGCGQLQERKGILREEWDIANDPLHVRSDYQRKFAALPTNGQLKRQPWSDTYWPSNRGGIAARWNSGEDGFSYKLNGKNKLRSMSQYDLAGLSPAEKFDILRGDFTFDLVTSERRRTSPMAPRWEGLCHGWAQVAMDFEEPKPVLVKTASGISVPFGAADVKALLTYYAGQRSYTRTRFLGARCNSNIRSDPDAARRPECRDVNAGSFHLVLTNQIGLLKEGFVADVTRDLEVWNQPIYAFSVDEVARSQSASPGAAPGTVEEVTVRTRMVYGVENGPTWENLGEIEENKTREVTYEYRLELDKMGTIIGGEWLTFQRPDFLWIRDKPTFTRDFKPLQKLYQMSISADGSLKNPRDI